MCSFAHSSQYSSHDAPAEPGPRLHHPVLAPARQAKRGHSRIPASLLRQGTFIPRTGEYLRSSCRAVIPYRLCASPTGFGRGQRGECVQRDQHGDGRLAPRRVHLRLPDQSSERARLRPLQQHRLLHHAASGYCLITVHRHGYHTSDQKKAKTKKKQKKPKN